MSDGCVDDAHLASRAQEGCLDAFELLVERYSAMAYRVALRMLGNHDDAQDVAQECLVLAWRNLGRFRGESLFSTWLYRIVTRQALNRLTRGKVYESLNLLDQIATREKAADPQLSAKQATVDAVGAAVSALLRRQRVAVVLHLFDGLSYIEVAEVTHSSVASVRSHLFRARRTLSVAFAKDYSNTETQAAHGHPTRRQPLTHSLAASSDLDRVLHRDLGQTLACGAEGH